MNITVQDIDITNLRARLGLLWNFTKEGHRHKIIPQQGGLLVSDLVLDSPPRNLAASQEKAVEYSKNVFAEMPVDTFPKSQRGNNEIAWLYSGPQFILGVSKENYRPEMDADVARFRYGQEAKKKTFGTRYQRIGKRGKQVVMRLNRIVIRKGVMRGLQKKLRDSFGKLKGAWAAGWDDLPIRRALPNWIRRHKNSPRGSCLLNLSGENPTITLINRARGVESNEEARKARKFALIKRADSIVADIRNQLRGDYRKAGFKNAFLN